MAHNYPIVQENTLKADLDGHMQEIPLGTPAWYRWLDSASAFTFRSSSGTFTARKERASNKRGGWYWKAFHKRAGKLHSAYLGKSEVLTIEHLCSVATRLNNGNNSTRSQLEGAGIPTDSPASEAVRVELPPVEQTSRPTRVRFSDLPPQLTSLVGREQDIARVCALLRRPQARLLSLLGPGGVGKTRLALAMAAQLSDEFADGAVFVSLATVRTPSLVISALTQALGMRRGDFPDVQRFLQDRHLLLILDNVEQVASAAPLIEKLMVACPRIKVVTTSRVALHLAGEQEFPVCPLALPDPSALSLMPADEMVVRFPAILLFVQRAQALFPDFSFTSENRRFIAEICARLDGLPLAIELAAARIKLFPPQALLARLSQRLPILTGGASTLPERQRTLCNTLQWSYDLLNVDEQWLFRRLSVFVGGCTLEALGAVCGAGKEDQGLGVVDLVSSLLDHSLVSQIKQEGEASRLTLLETVREYALACLEKHGEVEETRRIHALYYLTLAEEIAARERAGRQQLQWLRQLTEEQENLRAALHFFIEHQEAELAVQLSGALWWYWINRGSFSEGRAFLAASLSLPHSGKRTQARARALTGAGEFALRQGNYHVATALLEESAASYHELGDTHGLARSLLNLGLAAALSQRFMEAHTLIEQSITLSREVDDGWLLGHARDSLARLAWKQGDLATTRALSEQNLVLASQIGEIRAQVSPRKLLATVALVEGDYNRAADLASDLFTISREVGDRETEFSALFTLGTVALRQDDHIQAENHYRKSLDLASEMGSAGNSSIALSRLGELAYEQGNHALADERLRESLSYADAFEEKDVIGVALFGLARIAKAEKHYWRAAHLLGAAEARINARTDLDAFARMIYERDIEALQTYLGKEAFTQAWDEGRTMPLEQVLAVSEPVFAVAFNMSPRYPDELTAREMDVLRLVAHGFTDRQVAEKLVISPRTVQGHLRSIYSKIQANSRSAATRYAIEHHLL